MNPSFFKLPFVATALLGLVACGKGDDSGATVSSNRLPVASAGADKIYDNIEAVTLTGAASYDPDGDPLTYHWAFDFAPQGSALMDNPGAFSTNASPSPATSFVPDAEGTYVVRLVVNDGRQGESTPDFVSIEVQGSQLPTANAGLDQSGHVGDSFTLDATSSYDASARSLTYHWDWAIRPSGSAADFSDASGGQPTFTADVVGVYIASLVVDNGVESSIPDSVTVNVTSADAMPPVADAGFDATVEDCTIVTLNGTGSSDPNGDPIDYFWTVQSVPEGSSVTNASVADRYDPTTSFFADTAGTYTLSLSVYDGTTWSSADVVTYTAIERPYNEAPEVNAGADTTLDAPQSTCTWSHSGWSCSSCDTVVVPLGADAVVNDANDDPFSFSWTGYRTNPDDVVIEDPSALSTTATIDGLSPTRPGKDGCKSDTYEFRLTATDCPGATVEDAVVVTVMCCGIDS